MMCNIFCCVLLYVLFMVLTYMFIEEFFENPLWLGLTVMFWPIAIVYAIPYAIVMLFVNWIKSCIEYYKEKRNGKN